VRGSAPARGKSTRGRSALTGQARAERLIELSALVERLARVMELISALEESSFS
jgi:hypothetical protein